ncbi:putative musashi RNA-binding protein 2a [Triplophysa rosa]|uniref:Musashi RNA-binding protein 2a n=1 Tax=Triplophysa rosa TaxID=992332 RepID=A0A9W7TB81_TRIRA|nr:putative musashi RNA-binding protein 2a [Triplophysa rosa]
MVTRTKKIFVGGLSASTVVEDVKQYFEQFGKIHRFYPTGLMLMMLFVCVSVGYPNIVATYGRGYTGFSPSYSYQFPGFPATAYGPVAAAAAVAAARGSGRATRGRCGYMAYPQNTGPDKPSYRLWFPDYGFYSGPGDQRAAPCSFADYATLGPHTGQMLQSEHVTSTCNSPSQHHPSPDHFKSSVDQNCGVCVSCTGVNPPRPLGFPGANSPGPVADLYGPSSQDSAVGNYISAASPQPASGFNHSIAVIALTWLVGHSFISVVRTFVHTGPKGII